MKDVELEVFRADTRASRGITSKDIAETAAVYDPAKAPAAVCIGHPKNDTPAYGVIAKLRAEGPRLFATIKDLKDEVVEGIKKGELINRSFAFFSRKHEANPVPGKLYPRHLGFLGASAPGIPGMSNIKAALAFSAEDELEVDGDPAPAIVFGADEDLDPTPIFTVDDKEPRIVSDKDKAPTAEQLAAERKKLDDERAAFAAEQEKAAKASIDSTVDGLVKDGKLLPKDADSAKLIFGALDDEPLEFEAGKEKLSPRAALANLIASGVKLVPLDEEPTGKGPAFSAEDKDDPKKIEAAARKLMDEDKSLTFEAAVEKVSSQAKGK